MPLRYGLILVACIVVCVAVARSSPAIQDDGRDHARRIEAVAICNAIKFVTWPDETFDAEDDRIIVGVLDDDGFAEVLRSSSRGRRAHDRRLSVVELRGEDDSVAETAGTSHVLFVGASARDRLAPLLATLEGRPVLTIANIPRSADSGVMIELAPEDDRIVFRINREATERAGLRMSARLLSLAHLVEIPSRP